MLLSEVVSPTATGWVGAVYLLRYAWRRGYFNWSHRDVFHLILTSNVRQKHNKLFIA